MTDVVNHPKHYGGVPGIECIEVVEHFPFCRGNAIKYLWRAGSKGDLVEDLRKAIWYIQREIDNAVASQSTSEPAADPHAVGIARPAAEAAPTARVVPPVGAASAGASR